MLQGSCVHGLWDPTIVGFGRGRQSTACGKLSALYGGKSVILTGTALFLVGSVACGLAPSMGVLIAARALQGLGAGAMQPISMTIIGDIFDLSERAKMQGVFSAVWGLSALI